MRTSQSRLRKRLVAHSLSLLVATLSLLVAVWAASLLCDEPQPQAILARRAHNWNEENTQGSNKAARDGTLKTVCDRGPQIRVRTSLLRPHGLTGLQ